MQASAHRVERLVKHLVAHRIVEELWSADAHETMLADAEQVSVYRLAPAVVRRLAQFARRNELERAELGASPAAEGGRGPIGTPWTASDSMARLKNGRYEFLELVAVGGVGRVYRAVDRRFNREVAVKVLAPHLASDEAARRRWRREAEIAIQLKHPHVVRTYDVVDDGSSALAIVMELVSGPQLRAVLPLKTPAATVVADQLLSALTYAQGFGLARFDIKPENVVFKGGTRAVIVDLGIVKRSRQDSAEFSTALSGTSIAAPLGTPAYMSPEQALGEAVDIRSDVYAVALVLYETIVGQHLRDLRGSTADVLLQVTSEPPPLTELDVSTELQAVLTRALARNPDERFSGPEEMSDALLRTPEGQAGRNLEEQELLAPRHPKPAKRRFGVMQSVRDPEAHQVT
jgi:serine/threonine-protein kinase